MKTDLRTEQMWLATGSLLFLAMVALAVSLSYIGTVMIPFVLAIFIATMVSPVVDFQVNRWKFPRVIAISVALLLVLAVLAVLGLLLSDSILTMARTPDEYSEKFEVLSQWSLQKLHDWDQDGKWGLVEQGKHLASQLRDRVPSIFGETVSYTVGAVRRLLSSGFLIVIFLVFLLAGRQSAATASGIYAEIESTIRRYLTAKFLLSALTGLLVWITLALFGLQMASLFGVLAFLLNFIPSIGSVIATLLPIPIAIAQFYPNVWVIIGVVAVPGAIQMTIGNVIEPRLLGQELKLHPVTILLSLAFWGLLWGPIGMLLAVPITATIRIVLMRFTTTRPISNLLAGELPRAPDPPSAGQSGQA